MPWFTYVHPVLAVLTLVYGLTVGQTSLSKLGEWDFPLRRLRWRTFIFFVLCVVNLLLGLFVNIQLRAQGRGVELTAHLLLAVIVCVLALLAALVTFSPSRPGEVAPLMRWHPILSVASLGVILTSGFLTLLKVLKL